MCVCVCVCVRVCVCVCVCLFVVTKSLSGFVSNQMQHKMEGAQYLGESYYIIITINRY